MTKQVSINELAMMTKGKAKSIIKRAKKQKVQNSGVTSAELNIARRISNRLTEEMSELSKEITKANRFGYLAEHNKSGELYVDRILDEAQDVIDNIAALRKVLKPIVKASKEIKYRMKKEKA